MNTLEEVKCTVLAGQFIESQVQAFEAVFGHEDIGTDQYIRLLDEYINKLIDAREAARVVP